jgi:hypothetical protein
VSLIADLRFSLEGDTVKSCRISIVIGLVVAAAMPAAAAQNTVFNMARSASAIAAGCIPNASARVAINSLGSVEVMHVEAVGLPPNTEFDLFVIQVPNAPFGLSWYQGDMVTSSIGRAVGDFIGRFSIETFIVAPGPAAAPVIHGTPPFADANTNPPTAPVHTHHVGLWFGSASAALAAGCPGTVTPFAGAHRAGIQALSTRNFANLNGPLRGIH